MVSIGDKMFHKDLQDALRLIDEGKSDEALAIVKEHKKVVTSEAGSNKFLWARIMQSIRSYEANIGLAIENIQARTDKTQQKRYIMDALVHFDEFARNTKELVKLLEKEQTDLG